MNRRSFLSRVTAACLLPLTPTEPTPVSKGLEAAGNPLKDRPWFRPHPEFPDSRYFNDELHDLMEYWGFHLHEMRFTRKCDGKRAVYLPDPVEPRFRS